MPEESMREIVELKEIQSILLDMLVYLDKVCRENHLKYFIVDGTLLGAVRHKGFIPWDDDADVWMPREDYDRLADFVNHDESPYLFQTPQNTVGFTYSYGKLVDTRTEVEEEWDVRISMGLFLDVFPYDGLPDPATAEYDRFVDRCMFLQSQRMAALFSWKESRKRRGGLSGFCKWLVRRMVGCKRIVQKIDKNARKYPVQGSRMVGCLGGGYHKDQMMEADIFSETVELNFENHLLMAPAGYDRYLTKLYGDYMVPPPREEQKVRHLMHARWKESSTV